MGDFAEAGVDMSRLLQLGGNAHAMLFHFLARVRAGETAASAAAELEANAAQVETRDWPYPVIELYLEKRGADATMSAAKPDERCWAHFYVGEWHMLQNNRDEAAKALQVAKDTCPKDKDFDGYTAAVADLQRLGDAVKVPEPAATKTSGASQEMELGFWNSVKDSDDPAMLQAYLDQFPNGTFVSIAKLKVEKLKKIIRPEEQKVAVAPRRNNCQSGGLLVMRKRTVVSRIARRRKALTLSSMITGVATA